MRAPPRIAHPQAEAGPGGVLCAALVGSSNFTLCGLGFGAAPNVDLNLEVRDAGDREALLRWFDGCGRIGSVAARCPAPDERG